MIDNGERFNSDRILLRNMLGIWSELSLIIICSENLALSLPFGVKKILSRFWSDHRSQTELTNSFFGPLKWLPKAPKVQKSPSRVLYVFSNKNCSLMYIYISICIYLWNKEFLVDFKFLLLQIVTGIQVIINVAWNPSHHVGILQKNHHWISIIEVHKYIYFWCWGRSQVTPGDKLI